MIISLIGDMGGHVHTFERAIRAAGGNPDSGTIEADHLILQVGDLVRLVPGQTLASDACVALADKMLTQNPARWIQLWGNHDAACIGGPLARGWRPERQLAPQTLDILRRWWKDRSAVVGVALTANDKDRVLVTHAGVTRFLWLSHGSPTCFDLARRLNADVGEDPLLAFRAGRLVTGVTDLRASPVWAEVSREVYASWWNCPAPFTQVHGHASPWHWVSGDWWPDTPANLRRSCVVDRKTRRTVTTLADDSKCKSGVAVGIDWDLEGGPSPDIWPLLQFTLSASPVT